MTKRFLSIILVLVMVMTLFVGAIPTMAAQGEITLRLHYHRPDGDYEGWEVWFWDEDGIYDISGKFSHDGSATDAPPYQLEQGDGETVCTVTIPSGIRTVGYIIRYGSWEDKDVDCDQFIDLTGILSGTVDFYVESGVQINSATDREYDTLPSMTDLCAMTIQYNGRDQKVMVLNDDCIYGTVVLNAEYDYNKNRITVTLSQKDENIDLNTFVIYGANGVATNITEIKSIGNVYYLFLDQVLPLDKAFNISYDGYDYPIEMPDYYSNNEFETRYTYDGNDLGQTYTKDKTTLKVWAPLAVSVRVYLYENGNPAEQEDPDEKIDMVAGEKGVWSVTLDGDRNGTYYTYYVDNYTEQKECVDPYARAVGVNGRRGMIIDLDSTDPEGWANDKDPHYDYDITDAVIWELHVRDLTSDASSGVKQEWRGKYLGLTQTGTTNSYGQSTGLDYIKNLGITHIHLLPVYDFGSVDETKLNQEQYNWGYDPMNYNVPEGSYSTDPYNGEVRVREFKQMVKGLHDNGISVIMDVVYNHVYDGAKFCMNNTVPDYFSRPEGSGSGCGNDTASERSMVHKYIVDSVNYWVDEYHIDGFRFDLAGVLDTDTINEIVKTVQAKHPNVIFYGEGWTSGGVVFTKPGMSQAVMSNSTKTPGFAYFSDNIRTYLKGSTFAGVSAGYISGGSVGDLDDCFRGMPNWCTTPTQSINYISAHDNNTLFDHITLVNPYASVGEKAQMNMLGAAFYLAAQGVPFMQAGEEILRSKPATAQDASDFNAADGFFHNSYRAPDRVNSIKWDTLNNSTVSLVHDYYQGLIAFRKEHPALRLTDADEVYRRVSNLSYLESNVLGYHIDASGIAGETAEEIVCIYNPNKTSTTVTLPEGKWHICVQGTQAGTAALGKVSDSVTVNGISAMILVKSDFVSCDHPSHDMDGLCQICYANVGHSFGSDHLCDCGLEEAGSRDPDQDPSDATKPSKTDRDDEDEDDDDRSDSSSLFDSLDPITLIAIILLVGGVAAIVVITIILIKRKKA